MPGTPTTPDNLPIIVDTDSPDIPRDMNELANKTQLALNNKQVLLTGQGICKFAQAAVASGGPGGSNLLFDPATFDGVNVALGATNQRFVLNRAGWWTFQAYINSSQALLGRSFVEAIAGDSAGVPQSQTRFSIAAGEDRASSIGLILVPAGATLWWQVYHSTGVTVNFNGIGVVKFTGTNP